MTTPSAIITGASSGIGEALAIELAARGFHLGLTARRVDRLDALRARILADHPKLVVIAQALDVTDLAAVQAVIPDLMDQLDAPAWVIANAGVGSTDGTLVEQAATMIDTNLTGAVATIEAAIGWFERHPTERRSGMISRTVVGVSSVAGFRGLPQNPVYSATKAGLSAYLEGRRASLDPEQIRVVDIAPGFIDTPMAGGDRPAQISAADAARIMADRIDAGAYQAIVPTWPWAAIRPVMRHTPAHLFRHLVRRLG